MEDTACGDNCTYVKCGMAKTCQDCPFYVESWWTKTGQQQPKLVKDCSPKRQLLLQQEAVNRQIGNQCAIEELRNKVEVLGGLFKSALDSMVEMNRQHINSLENKPQPKLEFMGE